MEIGVDIVEHERVNLKLADKILTNNELLQFQNLKLNIQRVEYLASRFAAKEAIIKATNQKYKMNEIEILRTSGRPQVNIENIKISISHEKKYSIAMCVYCDNNEY